MLAASKKKGCEIIAKSMKQIEKLKRGDNPQDDSMYTAISIKVVPRAKRKSRIRGCWESLINE
jgi:hypothetical protein